ncbi:MAG: hypothetical protein SF187_28950 [Deltaproteobacteria bacterium]|nr:hypothetical protein [Deltaproteobacteria bacterium]
MNHSDLANAIVHWLEYERLCGRSNLLSEAALKAPVGEFLLSTQGHSLEVEVPYPKEMQPAKGRPRSVDFCLRRAGGGRVWTSIVESKWANGKRDLSQEVFDDLLRLEHVRRSSQVEPFERVFLLAGQSKAIVQDIFEREANGADGRVRLFEGVLPQTGSAGVPVANAPAGIVKYWHEAAINIGLKGLPLTMKTKLVAMASAGTFDCWVWRISSARNRKIWEFGEQK